MIVLFCRNAFELQALQDGMAELKQSLSSENIGKFEDCVEVHMHHIMSGLSRSDLHKNNPSPFHRALPFVLVVISSR